MLDCIRKSSHHPEWRLAGTKIAPRQFTPQGWKEKWAWVIAQTHHIQYITVKQGTQVLFTPFYSFLLLFTPFDSLLVPFTPFGLLKYHRQLYTAITSSRYWLHHGATNEASRKALASWWSQKRGQFYLLAPWWSQKRSQKRGHERSQGCLIKLDRFCGKTGIETGMILAPILKTGLDLIPILVSFWSQV